MHLDPDALADKPVTTVARWAYYATEQAGYESYREEEAAWRLRRGVEEAT